MLNYRMRNKISIQDKKNDMSNTNTNIYIYIYIYIYNNYMYISLPI